MIAGGADVDLPTLKGGETPLILAAERGLYHCTKALLDARANTQLVAKVHPYSGLFYIFIFIISYLKSLITE